VSLAEEIVRAVKTLGIEQQELAALLHVTPRTIMRWKKGDSHPSGATLDLLHRLLADHSKKRRR
jgi:DNA-binding transcriptional regulator YiaG